MNLSIANHVKSASAGSDSVCFSGATLAVASNTIPPGIRMNTEIPLFGCFICRLPLRFAPGQCLRMDQGFLFGAGMDSMLSSNGLNDWSCSSVLDSFIDILDGCFQLTNGAGI